jgi:uncharacterized membrane protein HdeD (DUF308 family)
MMVLVGNWWTFVLRGVLAVLFGILALILPGMALLTLVFLFGFYALADGVISIVAAFRRTDTRQQPWWALLIGGVISIIAGLLAFFIPGITALALLYIIAAWALVTGVIEIIASVRLRKQIEGEWLLALTGVLSIIFGVLLAVFPGSGALALVLFIGAYAIVIGVLLIVLGFKLRKWIRRTVEELTQGFPTGVAPGH